MTITSYDGRTGRANGTVEEISPHDFWTVVERTASASSAVTAASLRYGRSWLLAVAAVLVENTAELAELAKLENQAWCKTDRNRT